MGFAGYFARWLENPELPLRLVDRQERRQGTCNSHTDRHQQELHHFQCKFHQPTCLEEQFSFQNGKMILWPMELGLERRSIRVTLTPRISAGTLDSRDCCSTTWENVNTISLFPTIIRFLISESRFSWLQCRVPIITLPQNGTDDNYTIAIPSSTAKKI